MNKLYIYGAGGLGREVLALVKALPEWQVAGFIDDGIPEGKSIAGLPVIMGIDRLPIKPGERTHVVVAVGDPAIRSNIFEKLKGYPVTLPALVHPTAILLNPNTVSIGPGSIISAGCILTTDIKIGSNVLVNLNTTIGHDVTVADHASIMPGVNIAGGVTIGERVLVGAGANVKNMLRVGAGARVGMGSVVTKNVGPGETVVGIPAKPMGQ